MLRAITIIGVVIAVGFLAWATLVMTGGRDWLVASMTEEKAPAIVAANEETPKQVEKPAEAKPADPAPAEAKPEEAKPAESQPDVAMEAEAEDETAEETAAAESEPAPAEATSEDPPPETAEANDAEKPADGGGDAAGMDPAGNPTKTAEAAEKGALKSPYQDDYESVAEEGHKKFMAAGCNGCHGGTGGGGMGPPLSNPVWIYGNDGDTLFRLIALGTTGLQEQGYTRKGSELVVGPMPPHGNIVKSNDDMWKIIAWIWSINPPDKSASAAQ
ncbi:MAG: c-type cytochrome [Methyloceanibacter sp.]|uniref:c-type cytochrome n=1 Tax=Methyloceanibacter sp. TaxID=1965321 RepID=UPI003EE0FB1E